MDISKRNLLKRMNIKGLWKSQKMCAHILRQKKTLNTSIGISAIHAILQEAVVVVQFVLGNAMQDIK